MQLRAETSLFDDALLYGDINDAKETAEDSYQLAYNTNQYFWFNSTGSDTGAHVAYVGKDVFEDTSTGYNLLLASDAIALRYGLYALAVLDTDSLDFYAYDADTATNPKVASFGTDSARIGQSSANHIEIDSNGFEIFDDNADSIASFGASSATIGQSGANRFIMSTDSLSAYDDNDNLYFYVDENELTYGNYTAASTSSAVGSTSTEIQYYLSTSSSSATGGSWSSSFPVWSSGYYIWTRTAITITTVSGTSTTSYTPSSSGIYDSVLTGALSDLLDKADESDAATSVVTTAQYYLSTSASSAMGGSWSSSVPTWSDGYYIWTRLEIVKTMVDGTTSTSYAPSSSGVYDSSVDIAASTALDYIYDDGTSTLALAYSSPSTATRKVQITSSNIGIYDDAYNYALVNSNGLSIYQGTSSATLVASFGSSIQVGASSSENIYIDSSSILMRSGTTELASFTSSSAQIGQSSSNHLLLNSSGMTMYNGSTTLASFTSSALSFYYNGSLIYSTGYNSSYGMFISFNRSTRGYGGSFISSQANSTSTTMYIDTLALNSGDSSYAKTWITATSNQNQGGIYNYLRVQSDPYSPGIWVSQTPQHDSDRRLKEDFENAECLDDIILKITPTIFSWKDHRSPRRHIGFIAQDVQSALEEVVDDSSKYALVISAQDENSYMSVAYDELLPLCVSMIQKQQQRIEELERNIL